jgi:hypothetical protein
MALAVTSDAMRRPLGLLGMHTWARSKPRPRKKDGTRRSGPDYAKFQTKESDRWLKQVKSTSEQVGHQAQLIHVMDREGDAFPLLDGMISAKSRFVVRMARNRVARTGLEEPSKVRALVAQAADVFSLEVPVAARAAKRAPRANKTSGKRASRMATVGFRASTLTLRRPSYLRTGQPWLPLHVVEVYELQPPSDTEPVNWVLFTTEPIETPADIHAVVELYRTRWLIEEYFKALKTGCAIEKREIESYAAMANLLAILAPIAWQMLLLRNLARTEPDRPALVALTPTQIEVLRACGHVPLPPAPTVRAALFAVAALGGHHIKREPGWLVLGRGMEKLLLFEAGWIARQSVEHL